MSRTDLPSPVSGASGLRTRYLPRSRIGQGLVSMAPWLDAVLILVFVVLIEGRFVVQPGLVVDIPQAPVRQGVAMDLAAVVLSVQTATPGQSREIVVFDDEPYLADDAAHLQRLKAALVEGLKRRGTRGFTLHADRNVKYGTLVNLMDMLRTIGFSSVNLATRGPGSGGGAEAAPPR